MWPKKTILVATDFSESSQYAARAALDLAESLHVPLVLLHAYPASGLSYVGIDVLLAADYIQIVENAARASLSKEAALLKGKGVTVTTMLAPGVPWEQIIAQAEKLDAGLIVMGTHGRRGLPRALIGSVAEHVVRLSSIPVLTFHAPSASTTADKPSS